MPSIGEIAGGASMPASIGLKLLGLSNPVTAGVAGAISLLSLVDKIGQGRKAANKFTENGGPQDILNKQLEAISSSGASQEEIAQATDYVWRDFLQKSNEFAAANPKQAKVVEQAIYQTPELTQTVQSLLGGANPLDTQFTNLAARGIEEGQGRPNPGPSIGGTLLRTGLAVGAPYLMNKLQTGSWTGGSRSIGEVAANPGDLGTAPEGEIQGPSIPGSTGGGRPGVGEQILTGVFGGAGDGGSLLGRLLPGIISTGATLAGGILSSRAAGRAANVQAEAANRAGELQAQAAERALGFLEKSSAQQQKNIQPWIEAGAGALRTIGEITGSPGYSFGETFRAPTPEEVMQNPGIQFQLQQGQRALEAYQRAHGTLLSGKAVKELNEQAQGIAQTGYGNVFNQNLQAYNTRYNTFSNERAARLNPQLALAGLGQTSVGQLNAGAQRTAEESGNIVGSAASNIGNLQTSAAAARASGYVGGANAWNNVLGTISNNAIDSTTIAELMKRLRSAAA